METTHILIRSSEIFLKGKNQMLFERKLISNIRQIARQEKVITTRGRFIMDFFPDHHLLKRVFGITSYSPAFKVISTIADIQQAVVTLTKKKLGTFSIQTKRAEKRFPHTSPEINVLIGKYLEEHSNLTFSLNDPDFIIYLEINQTGTFIFFETIRCFGGLPTGVEGEVDLLIEDSSSLLAGLQIMKRGVAILPLAFSPQDITLLTKFSPQKLTLKIIKDFSERKDLLVSGQNLTTYTLYETTQVILRPLIAYDTKQIKDHLQEYMQA